MNEKAKEVISNVKDVIYVNRDSTYHRITRDELGVLETTINNQEKKIEEFKEFADIIARHTKTGGGKYISIHIICDEGEPDYLILKKVVNKHGR